MVCHTTYGTFDALCGTLASTKPTLQCIRAVTELLQSSGSDEAKEDVSVAKDPGEILATIPVYF